MNFFKSNTQLIKSLIAVGTLSIVAACSSPAPTHLMVSPEINIPSVPTNLYNNSAQLEVVDMRVAKYIVSILKKDKAATILSAQEGLDDITKKSLIAGWNGQGLTIDKSSKNAITVTIEKAAVRVEQSSMSYVTKSEILITLKIKQGNKVLTSKFKNKGSSDGALSADIAVLERDFNHNFASVLQQIIISKDTQKFLAQ